MTRFEAAAIWRAVVGLGEVIERVDDYDTRVDLTNAWNALRDAIDAAGPPAGLPCDDEVERAWEGYCKGQSGEIADEERAFKAGYRTATSPTHRQHRGGEK